ncbi:MauE/DoxX family redox-associated membrane protein [Polyangium sp. y55x31]|uniref:MauE/DoxX family redox-associated membrane protein n=1 Tax=Polyangium sp. y55x31 TaxID=3042688 RepID=UPI002482FD8C|nr:MauE/DoxX family redox-associated membrane protein [Polyangium sp. y55x31]MDI1478880.1 MauE/DoxX family redox-associated membrane protein [Polyangium sp. y55x31]
MKTALLWLLRLGLGGMFVAAGALKFNDPTSFALEIHNYQLLPDLAPLLAATLPTVEIVLGLALLAAPRPWMRAGALGSTLVLGVFTVAVASVVARGVNITCGCFGEGSGPVTMLTVLRDVALVAAGVLLFWLSKEPPARPARAKAGA